MLLSQSCTFTLLHQLYIFHQCILIEYMVRFLKYYKQPSLIAKGWIVYIFQGF